MVQADETGWRQDGVNGYVWTFSTPTERYFLRRGRHKAVVDEVLDESFSGVLVSDFYAAYNHYPGPKQRCWAHLLRDIHDLTALYPEDAKLARWAGAIHKLYAGAKAFVHPEAKQRRLARLRLEEKILARCRPFLDDPLVVQGKLCRRIERFIKELLSLLLSLPCHRTTTPPSEASGTWQRVARSVVAPARSRALTARWP